MDIEAALTEMRALAASGVDSDDPDMVRLSELVQGVDQWMSRPSCGFAPADWTRDQTDR